MAARRAVGAALKAGDRAAEAAARRRVHDAKLALGERGRAWWLPAEPDAAGERLAAAIRTLLRKRGQESSICPSEPARVVDGEDWRGLMPAVRAVGARLAGEGWLDVTRDGAVVDPDAAGPVRLRRRGDRRGAEDGSA